MVKTDEVLRTLLEMGFVCVSLSEAMFKGWGRTDPRIPKSYFATDRLGKHPDAPVNRLCGERVVRYRTKSKLPTMSTLNTRTECTQTFARSTSSPLNRKWPSCVRGW